MRKYMRLAFGIGPHLFKAGPWIRRHSKHKEKYDLNDRYQKVRHLIDLAFKHFRIDLYVDGLETVPDEIMLITPNHQSLMDPVMLIYLLKKPISFVGKEEIKKVPYIRRIVDSIDGIYIERDNLRQEIKVIRKVQEALENDPGLSFVIFPEGTRTKNEDLSPNNFKAGSFKPGMSANKSILPVAIYGTAPILDKRVHEKRYAVQISFLKPIEANEYQDLSTTDVAKIVEDRITKRVSELRQRDLAEFKLERRYNKRAKKNKSANKAATK